MLVLKECIGENLHYIGFSNAILVMTPKAEATKVKIDNRTFQT